MIEHSSPEWRWWKRAVVRTAGFPVIPLLKLASEELAGRADQNDPDYPQQFLRAQSELTASLQQVLRVDGIRSAILLQNRLASRNNVEPFLKWDPLTSERKSRHRKWEMLSASYAQRYLVKNDTIGFFGPVAWAKVGEAEFTVQNPGHKVVAPADRSVFFEPWAVDAIADTITQLPGMSVLRKPKISPFLWVTQGVLMSPNGDRGTLMAFDASVLSLCDGQQTIQQIARKLACNESRVSALIDAWSRSRIVQDKPQLGISPWPEKRLQSMIDEIEDIRTRGLAQAVLDPFYQLRNSISDTLDNSDALALTLASLEEQFVTTTGEQAHRNAGKAYGGRSLIYLDSRRDIRVEVGADLLRKASPVLLLAEAARWLCWHVSEIARETLRIENEESRQRDLSSFWFSRLPHLRAAVVAALPALEEQMISKWGQIFEYDLGVRRVQCDRADIAAAVRTSFEVPWAGWSGARYFSPDLMVSSPSGAGKLDPDANLVVGEVHLAINSQRAWCFTSQLPAGEDRFSDIDIDSPDPMLVVSPPRESQPRLTIRTQNSLVRESDIVVEIAHLTTFPERRHLVPGHLVQVLNGDDGVVAEMPSGERFDILDTFSEVLMDLVIDRFSVVASAPHTPRITIDELVIAREAWMFDVGSLRFARTHDEAIRFQQARRWMARSGLPRHVFVSFGGEKPLFVDFASPILVNLLCRIIRTGTEGTPIRFTEMLPAIGTEWIADRSGAAYTSELRFTLVDQKSRQAHLP